MTTATLERQFFITTPNSVGTASNLADVVSHQAKADIRAIWGAEYGQQGQFYMITDDNAQVSKWLSENGYDNFREEDVLVVRTANQKGACAELAKKLADANVNVNYLFTTIFDNQPAIIFSTDDNQKALKLFN